MKVGGEYHTLGHYYASFDKRFLDVNHLIVTMLWKFRRVANDAGGTISKDHLEV